MFFCSHMGTPQPGTPKNVGSFTRAGGVDAATSEPPSETYSEHFATGPLSLGATSEVSSSHRAAGRDGDLPSDESYGDVFATALVSRARGSDVSPVQDSEMDASSDGSFARVDESSGRHRPLARNMIVMTISQSSAVDTHPSSSSDTLARRRDEAAFSQDSFSLVRWLSREVFSLLTICV